MAFQELIQGVQKKCNPLRIAQYVYYITSKVNYVGQCNFLICVHDSSCNIILLSNSCLSIDILSTVC